MASSGTDGLTAGDLRFYDAYVPALEAGNWSIRVEHAIEHAGAPLNVDADGAVVPLGAVQEVVVAAPQFAIPASAVVHRYPPPASTGRYGTVLPHVVFSDPMLPWARGMAGGGAPTPWLALLVFAESELVGGESSPTRSIATTVAEFLRPVEGEVRPAIEREYDVADDDACTYIRVPAAVFREIAPRLGELRYLAHCRRSDTGDRATSAQAEDGLHAVVVANRFPAAPAAPDTPPVKSIVHLVSVEGLEPYLVDEPDFGGAETVALLSLASWTFQTLPEHLEDFSGLFDALVRSEYDGEAYAPEKLLLRLPPPSGVPGGDPAARRLRDGFVPLAYHTRTGEETFAWYRGPLVPVRTTAIEKPAPFASGDAAIVYDEANGVFDLSLAAAWQIGRAAALADRTFGERVLDLRRRVHFVMDHLLHRLESAAHDADDVATARYDASAQDTLAGLLDTMLLQTAGAASAAVPADADAAGTDAVDDGGGGDDGSGAGDARAALEAFLARPEVQARLAAVAETDLEPIARWLGRLVLLYPVPFDYLVADARLLPAESIRFFYVDRNWIGALVDGALSIGVASTRDTLLHAVLYERLVAGALEAAARERRGRGGGAPTPDAGDGPISGLLLRSAVVSGWPNLAVRPRVGDGDALLPILRLDHLSPDVLFCLIQGVPDAIEFAEPPEGFRFGVDDDGCVPLRNLVAPTQEGDPPLGAQLPGDPMFLVRDPTGATAACLRSAASRVLRLAPDVDDGLVRKLAAANAAAAGTPPSPLGPGAFALQMVKSPEAILFTTPGGSPT